MEPSQIIHRHAAANINVSYSNPIAIRRTAQTHFEVLPRYIKHKSSPAELSLKIMYWKQLAGQLRVGYPAEFTLQHAEVIRLRDVLNNLLAVAQHNEDGNFLVVKVGEQEIIAQEGEAAELGRVLASALSDQTVVRALTNDEQGRLILGAVQASARLIELTQAIDDLECALNNGQSAEQFYQEWCEKHSWAFGDAYAMRDEVRTIAIGDQVDALMKMTVNGLRDIFELKRPDKDPLNYDSSHRCYYWTSESSKAIGQCHRYIDALHDGARQGLRDNPHIVAYYPRAFVIQGRSNDWDPDKLRALHGLNARLHGVQLMTYDQLVERAKQLVSILGARVAETVC